MTYRITSIAIDDYRHIIGSIDAARARADIERLLSEARPTSDPKTLRCRCTINGKSTRLEFTVVSGAVVRVRNKGGTTRGQKADALRTARSYDAIHGRPAPLDVDGVRIERCVRACQGLPDEVLDRVIAGEWMLVAGPGKVKEG